MTDSELRPPGTVELRCPGCGWSSWHDPTSAAVAAALDQAYRCEACAANSDVYFTCSACNRSDKKPHIEMSVELSRERAHHCRECLAAGVPYRSFAAVVWCWSSVPNADDPVSGRCPNVATHVLVRRPECDCPACWQTEYHACDEHLEGLREFFGATEVQAVPS